jgi:hypothetical protein
MKGETFLSSCVTVSFPRNNLLQGVSRDKTMDVDRFMQ